jgi:hypothetical protein
VTPIAGSGCTPGFWKNTFLQWQPTGYTRDQSFEAVFGRNVFGGDPSLRTVAGYGGGGIFALSRHAVAALLNAAHPGLTPAPAFDTTAEVIAAYQAAYDSGSISQMNALKDAFEASNQSGCPLPARRLEWSQLRYATRNTELESAAGTLIYAAQSMLNISSFR